MRHATAVMLQRSFYVVGLLVGVVTILYFARIWLVPLVLAVVLAFVLTPVVGWLEHYKLPRGPAVAVASLVALAAIFVIGFLVTQQLTGLADDLRANGETYKANLSAKLAPVLRLLQSAAQIEEIGKKPPVPPATSMQAAQEAPTPVVVESRGVAALSWLPSIIWPVLDIAAQGLLVVALAIYVLARRESMRDRVLGVLGPRNVAGVTRAMNDTAHRVSRYLLLLLCTNTGVGTVITLGLFFIGLPYALLCGMLAAALRFIPYIGVWIAAALAFGTSVVLFPGWTPALLVLGLFLLVEAVTANAVEPLLFGHNTGVSPLPLLLAAVFWTWLWGPAGLLLSTPMTVCLVVLGRHVPALQFLDVLLGTGPALNEPTRYYQRLLAGDLEEAATLLQCLQQEQGLEAVCDQVVVPALVRARRERDDEQLNVEEERGVLRATRLLMHSALGPTAETVTPSSFRVLACPAHGAADALALRLLGLLVTEHGGELRVVSARRLADEARQWTGTGPPAVICVAALPPDAIVQATRTTRHVHRLVPALKIIVGLWGQEEEAGRSDERLRGAGAAAIGVTLHETVDQIFAALGKPRPAPAKPPAPAPTIACP